MPLPWCQLPLLLGVWVFLSSPACLPLICHLAGTVCAFKNIFRSSHFFLKHSDGLGLLWVLSKLFLRLASPCRIRWAPSSSCTALPDHAGSLFFLPDPQAGPSLLPPELGTRIPSVWNSLSWFFSLLSPPSLHFKYHTSCIHLIWAAPNLKQSQVLTFVIGSGGFYHVWLGVHQQPPEPNRAVFFLLWGKAETTVARLKKHFHLGSLCQQVSQISPL